MTSPLPTQLREAAAGSRELDAILHDTFTPKPEDRPGFEGITRQPWGDKVLTQWTDGRGNRGVKYDQHFPFYSTSLDDVLELIDEILPEWDWLVTRQGTFSLWTQAMENNEPIKHVEVKHESRAISACLALLSAVEGGSDAD